MSEHLDPFVQQVHHFILQHLTPDHLIRDNSGILRDAEILYKKSIRYRFDARIQQPHLQPAFILAAAEGLHDIATHYQLPRGLCVGLLESYAQIVLWTAENGMISYQHGHDRLHAVIAQLEQDNPQLKNLRYERSDIKFCYHAILGVTSAFNTDDIQHYLETSGYGKAAKDFTYVTKFKAVATALNRNSLGWVPSPTTLDRIIAQKTAQLCKL